MVGHYFVYIFTAENGDLHNESYAKLKVHVVSFSVDTHEVIMALQPNRKQKKRKKISNLKVFLYIKRRKT